MKLPLLIGSALFVLAVFPLTAQDAPTETEVQEYEAIADEPPDDDKLYVIAAFEFDIKGRTRPSALIYNGEFKIGETIKGQENLDHYVRDKTQLLVNQRILKDNASVTYSIGEQAEDGSYPVTLLISTEDSWNIIALPKPEYKSDTGFDLSIGGRDYNFLGTMNPLKVNLGYKYDENKNSSFQFEVLSDIPFNAIGYRWEVKFYNSFDYRPMVEEPYYYQNVTGLSMELPFRKTTFTFGFDESTIVNEENLDVDKLSKGLGGRYPDFQSGVYMSSKLYTLWKIPTGFFVPRYGELTYTPNISATFNHEFPQWELQEIRRGPFLGFGHLLGFEKIDWHVNYRDGISVSIDNSYIYDFYSLKNDEKPLSALFLLNGTGHFIIRDFLGISTRLMYRQWFYHNPDYYDSASDAMRGIADRAITADYMLSLNADFPFRVLLFTPSEWFENRKLRFFDFELHASPVLDMALYHDPRTETSFHPKNTAVSGGLEFIIFPAFIRNFIVRLGYAMNLREFFTTKKFPGGNNREIYFILGHFY